MSGPGALTAEIRWWWRGGVPASVVVWFHGDKLHPYEARTDCYLRTGEPGIGIKQRGEDEGFEVKSLVAQLEQPVPGGRVELWTKHIVKESRLPHGSTIKVAKKRSLRHFRISDGRAAEIDDADAADCQLELVTVRAGRGSGISLSFEARASLAAPAANLLATLALLGPPPGRDEALIASYPAWLARLV